MKNEIDDLISDLKARGEKYDKISMFFGEMGEELATFLVLMWFIFTYNTETFNWFHYITAIPMTFLLVGNFSQFLNHFYGTTYMKRLNRIGYILSFGVMAGYATWALSHGVFCLMSYISVVPVIMLLVALVFIHRSLNISKQILLYKIQFL